LEHNPNKNKITWGDGIFPVTPCLDSGV